MSSTKIGKIQKFFQINKMLKISEKTAYFRGKGRMFITHCTGLRGHGEEEDRNDFA